MESKELEKIIKLAIRNNLQDDINEQQQSNIEDLSFVIEDLIKIVAEANAKNEKLDEMQMLEKAVIREKENQKRLEEIVLKHQNLYA